MIHLDERDVGDDIEAYCTSCRMDLNHVIIAKKGEEIKRVRCLTCQKDHTFRPPKGEEAAVKAASPKAKNARAAAAARRSKAKATREEQAWIEAVGKEENTQAVQYVMGLSFKQGDLVQHPTFGLGRVKEVFFTGKMEVIFKDGVKLLSCSRVTSQQG